MTQPVFKIENLKCEYIPDKPVLDLEQLEIPRGKLIFVIGKSGIGKSTFIETLGLMNQTIVSEEDTSMRFFPSGDDGIELKDSWELPNEQLSKFRRDYFSFIFQNTNLMPNFTSGENMMMNLLIKGIPIEKAKLEVLKVMDKLSLDEEVFDKKITELSGGQKQRLAFVRAITSEFTVLFGDEPTGNLDENTANELMGVLKQLIVEDNRTGIIVSHDLKLAKAFADLIIPITVEEKEIDAVVGKIDASNIITRKHDNWCKGNGEIITDPVEHLSQFLSGKTVKIK